MSAGTHPRPNRPGRPPSLRTRARSARAEIADVTHGPSVVSMTSPLSMVIKATKIEKTGHVGSSATFDGSSGARLGKLLVSNPRPDVQN